MKHAKLELKMGRYGFRYVLTFLDEDGFEAHHLNGPWENREPEAWRSLLAGVSAREVDEDAEAE